MNARQIASLWEHYTVSNELRLSEANRVATLYGMDEVEIDYVRGMIALSDAGRVQCPDLVNHKGEIDWVAMVDEGNSVWVVLGTGSPFDALDALPSQGGVITAIPAAVRRRIPGTLPGIPVHFPDAA